MVKKIKKKNEKIDFEKERRNDKNTIIVMASIAAAVGILVVVSYLLNPTKSDLDKVSIIDGIRCDKIQATSFHAYAHLDVFIEGQAEEVPADIGVINGTCRYWINTEDSTGILHIDAPQNQQFTMSQFFDVWKATNNLPPTGNPSIYLNGQKITSALNDTIIKPHDEIVVVYGSKPSIIPSSYSFPLSL